MRVRRRKKSDVHDREPNPLGRRVGGPKSARAGYPALFLGHAAATKLLVEIGALGPVAVEELPERDLVTAQNLGFTIRRLVALRLVRRYHSAEHAKHFEVALDQRHPFAESIAAVLRAIAKQNRVRWAPSPLPPERLAVQEAAKVMSIEVKGQPAGDIGSTLGSLNRTTAILSVATMEAVDLTTIARIAMVETDRSMHQLMDPIEADKVVVSEMVGSIRIYSVIDEPWTPALNALAKAMVSSQPSLENRIEAGRVLIKTGGFSNRVHLRRRMEMK
jgi:hypothetical protein